MTLTSTAAEVASVTMLLSGSDELRGDTELFLTRRAEYDPADLLNRYASSVRTLEAAQADLVAEMRRTHTSWDTIGRALGVSRQAAQQRYGR